ncbi:hypothetical protein TW95_gp0612 [Pandoravirus inopinatum]|uniref:Uncharacterized protein n=1 Tax=Pandoravirus inopinatum TaxID=1605721 RepID=A0A0B5J946_9VIRU|nr:hypothetical protein TW95_gp0612 [Pandoravirus inopinatum]AJF97346.1 hypothetical protein [Pandoravirus inopinatum]
MDGPTYDQDQDQDQDLHGDAEYDDQGGDDNNDYDHASWQGNNDGGLQANEAVYEMPADSGAACAVEDASAADMLADCTDQATAVRLFCTRWSRLRAQLDPLTAATRGIRLEQAALRRDLAAYMEGARTRRAVIQCRGGDGDDNATIVVRVDPMRPTTSMKREVITAAVYEHVTPDLVRACAEAAAAAAEKRSAKVAKAKAVAARKAARAAAAAARPAKRRRRTAKHDDDDDGDDDKNNEAKNDAGSANTPMVDNNPVATDDNTVNAGDVGAIDDADGTGDAHLGNTPALAEIMGAAVVEATRAAQRRATAQQTSLTVGRYDPDRDDESAMVDMWDASPSSTKGACEVSCPDARDVQVDGKSQEPVCALAAYAWSTEDVPVEVRAWATRFVELADVASGLRDRMRPIEVAIEALTLDLPPPPSEPAPRRTPAKGTARNRPSARAIEAAAKRERHEAFGPMRDAVARHLAEVGADKRGVPVRFPTSDALYRLRESVRTRAGTLTRTDYVPLAADAAAAAMAQVEIDPAVPIRPRPPPISWRMMNSATGSLMPSPAGSTNTASAAPYARAPSRSSAWRLAATLSSRRPMRDFSFFLCLFFYQSFAPYRFGMSTDRANLAASRKKLCNRKKKEKPIPFVSIPLSGLKRQTQLRPRSHVVERLCQ